MDLAKQTDKTNETEKSGEFQNRKKEDQKKEDQKKEDHKREDQKKEDQKRSHSSKKESDSDMAQNTLSFISDEATHLTKELRRFMYKHPLAVTAASLAAGYFIHLILAKSTSSSRT